MSNHNFCLFDNAIFTMLYFPQMNYALLSVFDKSRIVDFAKSLQSLGFEIISTGGTAKVLTDAKIKVIPIHNITGNPESFDGRMKTISFEIEGGILYDRKNPSHVRQAKKLRIKDISVVACNLYPFEQTTSNPKTTLAQAVENIDVGGPTMIRSAAKNFKNVLVAVDSNDYEKIIEKIKTKKADDKFRKILAAKAFGHLAFYDSQIAKYLNAEKFPQEISIPGRKNISLRYGENPHQEASVYLEPNTNSPLKSLAKLAGRDLSYLNFTDIYAGLESVRMFKEPAAAVIKHNSPCGIALGNSQAIALKRAILADPQSAFGGVIILNSTLDIATAKIFSLFKEENGILIDIVAAPNVSNEAADFIKKVRKSTGIYSFGKIPAKRKNAMHLKFFDGGFVMQDWDDATEKNFKNWKIVTKIKPTKKQIEQIKIAWKFISRIKSNTIIVIDKNLPMTRGIGSGQTSRIGSAKIALDQAGKNAKGAILASDSFFPFDDCVSLAGKYGIKAIVQQGGSVNDKASIERANKLKIAMVFTNERKFWH